MRFKVGWGRALLLLAVILIAAWTMFGRMRAIAQTEPHQIIVNPDFTDGVQSDGRTPRGWKSAHLVSDDGVYCNSSGLCSVRLIGKSTLSAWIYQVVDTPIAAGSTLTLSARVSAKGLAEHNSYLYIGGWNKGHRVVQKRLYFPPGRSGQVYTIQLAADSGLDHLNIVAKNGLSESVSKLVFYYVTLTVEPPNPE